MSNTVIKVENLSKLYRLGEVGTGTLSHDLNRFWARLRGKEDPFAVVGTTNDRTQQSEKGEYVWALQDINFEVKQGEVLGIIGKNGAGKSTLLKLLSRITAPTRGNIKIKGRVASLLEVGTGMHPEMTGRENVYLNGTILGMTRKEVDKKFEEIMDFAGCLKYADTPVKRYSSGMRVRLGFAVAAFLEPEILIVDEVLAVGDAEFQKKAIGKMQDVSKGEGRTVLFVSHNMNSISNICEKTLILENGGLDYIGDTEPAIERYLDSNSMIDKLETKIENDDNSIEVNNAKLLDQNDNQLDSSITPNLKFRLSFILIAKRELSNLQCVVYINNYKGEKVIQLDKIDHDKDLFSLKNGKYEFRVEIPNPMLVDGYYYITLAIKESGRIETLCRAENLISFEITNIGTPRLKKRKGYVFCESKWDVLKTLVANNESR